MSAVKLKFTEIDKDYPVTLSFDQPMIEKDKWGPGEHSIWYSIEEDIETGCTGFNASNDLHKMIQALQFQKGSTFVIRKEQGDTYTYFTIKRAEDKVGLKLNDISPHQNTSEPIDLNISDTTEVFSNDKKIQIMWEWGTGEGLWTSIKKSIKKDIPKEEPKELEPILDDDLPF